MSHVLKLNISKESEIKRFPEESQFESKAAIFCVKFTILQQKFILKSNRIIWENRLLYVMTELRRLD